MGHFLSRRGIPHTKLLYNAEQSSQTKKRTEKGVKGLRSSFHCIVVPQSERLTSSFLLPEADWLQLVTTTKNRLFEPNRYLMRGKLCARRTNEDIKPLPGGGDHQVFKYQRS